MDRIAIVCVSLRAGGTEKIVSMLANQFSSKHQIDIILLSNKEVFYDIHSGIRIWKFSEQDAGGFAGSYYFRIARFVRSVVKTQKSQVVLSFGELISPFVQLATVGLGLRSFVLNRGAPSRSMNGLSGWLNPVVYPLADRVVVQTSEARKILQRRYRFCKFDVIPNPVMRPESNPLIRDRRKVIVNVGSIGRLKNQEFLVKTFAQGDIADTWELHFVGDGPGRSGLEEIVSDLGLAHRIKFLGQRRDISQILSQSQIFAFCSLSEGFPNALAEALAHGCACISFDCPTGPSELIRNGSTGALIPMDDIQNYQESLRRLTRDEALRSRFSIAASRDMSRFSSEKIFRKFELLINDPKGQVEGDDAAAD